MVVREAVLVVGLAALAALQAVALAAMVVAAVVEPQVRLVAGAAVRAATELRKQRPANVRRKTLRVRAGKTSSMR